ncbi:MAG: Flp pilus assembly complex ATPase component TadA [Phycisphaerae bacterium]|nr:Flp pilus assembly complex ATPase component TadA [Phycisphaerae bacterium]
MKRKHTNADVSQLVDDILQEAVSRRASDIHFEPSSRKLQVKFRLDGQLKIVDELPKTISDNVIARLKVLGGLLTYRNDIPQEGRIIGTADSSIESSVTDKRLAVFPTIHGQRAVIRVFYEDAGLMSLDQLGFSDFILSNLKEIASRNQGVLLLTGPAGSGKAPRSPPSFAIYSPVLRAEASSHWKTPSNGTSRESHRYRSQTPVI